jgi:prepilin-type processing-associated H-X9-DG protein
MSNLRQIGLSADLYAQNNDGFVPRGTGTVEDTDLYTWFQLFMPFINNAPADNDFRKVKFFRCPSYPVKEQVLCYVINNWRFANISDLEGEQGDEGKLKLSAYKRLASTIYLADNENGIWRPTITMTYGEGMFRGDVYRKEHLPITDESILQARASEWEQHKDSGPRVAHKRHRKGCNLLFADWHVGYADAVNLAAEKTPGVLNVEAINLWKFKK